MVSAMPNGIDQARSQCLYSLGQSPWAYFWFSVAICLGIYFPCTFYVPKAFVSISRYNPIHAVVIVPLHDGTDKSNPNTVIKSYSKTEQSRMITGFEDCFLVQYKYQNSSEALNVIQAKSPKFSAVVIV